MVHATATPARRPIAWMMVAWMMAVWTMAVWALAASAALAQEARPDLFVGDYRGQVESGGQPLPAATRLYLRGGQAIAGDYLFIEGNGARIAGTLDRCVLIGSRRITCQWHDRYGTGPLEMTFMRDGSLFEGRWASSANPDTWYRWNGLKISGQ